MGKVSIFSSFRLFFSLDEMNKVSTYGLKLRKIDPKDCLFFSKKE